MADFLRKPFKPSIDMRRKLRLAFWNAIGVFFFILFFQPFWVEDRPLPDTMFLIAGMGLIVFILIVFILIAVPLIFPKWFMLGEWEEGPPDLLSLAIWLFTGAGLSFYIRFVGGIPMSLALVVRIGLICLVPPLVIRIDLHILALRNRIEYLQKPPIHESDEDQDPIEIQSSAGTDAVQVPSSDLLYMKTADNYVEVISRQNGGVKSELIRTTLNKICADLSRFDMIVRCHRAFIVNTRNVNRLTKTAGGYQLIIEGVSEPIPVSRAYQIKVKDMLGGR
ncbi:MAG: LytTR family DNA-binding domain-containing protein [Spirochaetaceae bacterium]|nr:LytTR family DNA-binding domain-containing protein [Spirochaetaceae bacterium]